MLVMYIELWLLPLNSAPEKLKQENYLGFRANYSCIVRSNRKDKTINNKGLSLIWSGILQVELSFTDISK